MPVNVRLLKKVRKLIAEEPRRLQMQTWGQDVEQTYPSDPQKPPCGTVACIAGWTILAAQPQATWKRWLRGGYLINRFRTDDAIIKRAAELLGMKPDDCPFFEWDWKAPEVLAWIDRQIDAAKRA